MEPITTLPVQKFDYQLENLASQFMPEVKVNAGDLVYTVFRSYSKRRPVIVYEVGFKIVSLSGIRSRYSDEDYLHWRNDVNLMGVDFYFHALRLDRNLNPADKIGYGIGLTNLEKGSYRWKDEHDGFNHIGMQWPHEALVIAPTFEKIKELVYAYERDSQPDRI